MGKGFEGSIGIDARAGDTAGGLWATALGPTPVI